MENFGKADVRVKLLDSLPGIVKNRLKHNFDITAHSWDILQNSQYFVPLLCENVKDPLQTFSAVHPSKRTSYVDNFMQNGDGTSAAPLSPVRPYILWKAIGGTSASGPIDVEGAVKDLIIQGDYDSYILEQPDEYPAAADAYLGPEWVDDPQSREPFQQLADLAAIERWLAWLGLTTLTVTEADDVDDESDASATTTVESIPKINWVNQRQVKDGLWWGIESSEFLDDNMPFWVRIKRQATPPTNKHATCIIISLGLDSDEHAFDLFLQNNERPRLMDYYKGRAVTGTGEVPRNEMEFHQELARIFDTEGELTLGFMTIGGRLVVFVNKLTLVYTRVVKEEDEDEIGRIAECILKGRKIRIYGTNIQCTINVSPMTFAPIGLMALPISTPPPTTDPTTGLPVTFPPYRNVLNDGSIGNLPVCVLPTNPDDPSPLYGIDAATFQGIVGTVNPSGTGFHQQGLATLAMASSFGITGISATDFYVLRLAPEPVPITFTGVSFIMRYGGTPYFFRLKGGINVAPSIPSLGPTDVSEDVISVNETHQAPDYFHVKGSATVVLYNKGGTYDYLKEEQKGITIEFGWNGDYALTFTGMTTSASSVEKAGMETIEVTCEDYMFILQNTPIVNSPFYDGMVMFYAIEDMAKRAGIENVVNDWDSTDDYFLPSGFAFTKPAVRFSSKQMLFECMMYVVKRPEAFIFFDEFGFLHVRKLPGGLFSVGAGESIVAFFTRDPAGPNTIIEERNVQYDLSSTVNRISIFTLDRDTRNAIVYTKSAIGPDDKLIYRRIFLHDQAALGEYEVAVARAEELAERIFFPIRKTSFRIYGSGVVIYPLDFIDVEGEEFRVMSISRKYDANSNTYENEYNCEWLGGA